MNGVSLGGVFGLYASKGILPLLVAFVAPHGVLELSAICIGAGGGLLVAAAMLVPGDRTRRRALAENGARAMRLLAGAALFLLVAGSLEGMVSPIPYWPLSLKLIVSATTLVLMIAFLRGGAGSQQPARLDLGNGVCGHRAAVPGTASRLMRPSRNTFWRKRMKPLTPFITQMRPAIRPNCERSLVICSCR